MATEQTQAQDGAVAVDPELEVSRMIDALSKLRYRVVTEEEYKSLASKKLEFNPPGDKTSTPKPIVRDRIGRGRARSLDYTLKDFKEEPRSVGITRSTLSTGQLDSNLGRIPKIPTFSGQEQKGDVSFNVWRYEVRCLLKDVSLPETVLLQAIRQSLKGTAREMLIPLGETATGTAILSKLEGLYGNVETDEATLQKFYTESQQEGESVTAYACRLETLLHASIESGYIDRVAKETMLRSKFWTSLNERLKTQTRNKYETIKSFDMLVREVRAIELELTNNDKVKSSAKKGQHQPVHAEQMQSKIEIMAEQLTTLCEKIKDLDSKVIGLQSNSRNSNNSNNSRSGRQNRQQNNSGPQRNDNSTGKGKASGQQPKD
ncbi:uncharacterized protein LOC117339721 [Pecten maximus]|uniref:uncharacterized protein LOC117339721 n=1 Tax=Pecten maximus TaxID=6579 RepID=UPI001458FDBB|nr:uncharacterized protein LOC117339721 [Pecten maximus]